MINKISFFDFDGCLVHSPEPEWGRGEWERVKGVPYPHKGWWGRGESLDLDVFDIKPINSIVSIMRKDINTPNTLVVILTSRLIKLKNEVKSVLDSLNLYPDIYDLKKDNKSKGERVLEYLNKYPGIKEINVYDDNYEREIVSYKSIVNQIPNNVVFNIFHIENERAKRINEISEKIRGFILNDF